MRLRDQENNSLDSGLLLERNGEHILYFSGIEVSNVHSELKVKVRDVDFEVICIKKKRVAFAGLVPQTQ